MGARCYPEDVKLTRVAVLALVACCSSCAANDGVRFETINVANMAQPDADLGAPPPPDYTPCWTGEARAVDTDGDGKPDRVRVSFQGRDRCYGEDTNHNGKIDTWDVVDESGRLTKRAHDSNDDGKVDQAWTFDPTRKGCATVALDANGDGKPDPGSTVDICQQLTGTGGTVPPKLSDHP
jgi:hypothetical protein